MKNIIWKDEKGNIRCESCGKIITGKLFSEKGLLYCKKCHDDILKYNAEKLKS